MDNLGTQEVGRQEDQPSNPGKSSIFDLFTRKTSSASRKSLPNDVEYMNLSAIQDVMEADSFCGPVGYFISCQHGIL